MLVCGVLESSIRIPHGVPVAVANASDRKPGANDRREEEAGPVEEEPGRAAAGGTITAEQAYERLRRIIVNGEIPAGTRIVEEATARRLGVSRTPVREAIFRLESERLVTRDQRGGAVVAELSSEEIEDVYAVRSALEGLAARLAVGKMSHRDFVRLEHIQERLKSATREMDADELATLNFWFHEVILKSTHNATLINFMGQIHASLRRATRTTLAYPGRAEEALEEHEALIEALKGQDADESELIARRHIDSAFNIRLLLNVREELD